MSDSAYTHRTVMLKEAVDALCIKSDGVYVDGTFGRGGHSRLILSRLGDKGRLIAFDKDLQAIAEAKTIHDERFVIVHRGFTDLATALDALGVVQVDGVLLDLGISSPQIDDAERGFSFRFDAPLDMRMDTSQGLTAAEWINSADEAQLIEVIRGYGEERYAKQIAKQIVATRVEQPILRTRQLAQIVAKAVRTREAGQDPATRTFQAIRIFINQELEEVSAVLPQCLQRLAPEGYLAVISFHSLEDRIVKQFMREASQPPLLPSRLPVRADQIPPAPLRLCGRAMKPSQEEVAQNPRARSAIMRVAQKVASHV